MSTEEGREEEEIVAAAVVEDADEVDDGDTSWCCGKASKIRWARLCVNASALPCLPILPLILLLLIMS